MSTTTNKKLPIIAVIGATGQQGGAVVDALFKQLKDKVFVRAITRNTKTPAAQRLVNQNPFLLSPSFAGVVKVHVHHKYSHLVFLCRFFCCHVPFFNFEAPFSTINRDLCFLLFHMVMKVQYPFSLFTLWWRCWCPVKKTATFSSFVFPAVNSYSCLLVFWSTSHG